MRKLYLDYNATAPIRAEVIASASEAMAVTGNASSIHSFGRDARKIIEDARAQVAALAAVRPAQIIFNSGATEGNNTILSGYRDQPVFIGATEHPSVTEAAPHAARMPVRHDGVINLDLLDEMLNKTTPALVSVQLVNSETGVIQPIADIAARAKAKGALIHCDAVQAAGRLDLNFKSLGVDYLTLSAHKFGGPQGIGALIFREGLQIPKFLHGGGQEKRQRAGTENVAAIAGFGTAAHIATSELPAYQVHTQRLQQHLETALRHIANDLILIGENAPRVTNTTNIMLPGVPAETQLMAMDLEGIALSSGSACSSGTFKPSHVLTAMGYTEAEAKTALRISYGYATTMAEIDACIAAYARVIKRIKP